MRFNVDPQGRITRSTCESPIAPRRGPRASCVVPRGPVAVPFGLWASRGCAARPVLMRRVSVPRHFYENARRHENAITQAARPDTRPGHGYRPHGRGPHGPAALLRRANSQNLPPPGHPQMTGPTPSRHASTISGVVGSRLSVSPYSDSAPRGSRMAPRPCILTPSTRVPHLLLRVGCMSRSALLTCSPWSTVASPLRPSFS